MWSTSVRSFRVDGVLPSDASLLTPATEVGVGTHDHAATLPDTERVREVSHLSPAEGFLPDQVAYAWDEHLRKLSDQAWIAHQQGGEVRREPGAVLVKLLF